MDNQAVLMGLSNQKSKPGHHLIDRIHDTLEDLQVTQTRLRGRHVDGYRKGAGRTKLEDGSLGWKEWKLKVKCEVNFVWTPGHEGIEGNEKADEAAKDAASGQTSKTKDLPPFLRRKPLPVSISATKQLLKKKMKARWQIEWKTSKRYADANSVDATLPSDNFLHIIDQLRRNQASLLTQLRTGHIPLNTILHRIKRAESAECPHCKKGIRETIHHYLLTCPRYAAARRLLLQAKLKRDSSSIPFLIGSRIAIPRLLRYISATKRFSTTFGEVRPKDNFILKNKTIKENPKRREENLENTTE